MAATFLKLISCEYQTFDQFFSKTGNPSFVTDGGRSWLEVAYGTPPESFGFRASNNEGLIQDQPYGVGFKTKIVQMPTSSCYLFGVLNSFQLYLDSTGDILVKDCYGSDITTLDANLATATEYDIYVAWMAAPELSGGELRVLVNGSQVGSVVTADYYFTSSFFQTVVQADTVASIIKYRAMFAVRTDTTTEGLTTWGAEWEIDPLTSGTGFTSSRAPDTGTWLNVQQTPASDLNTAQWDGDGTVWTAWAQSDGTGSWTGPNGSFANAPWAVSYGIKQEGVTPSATYTTTAPNSLITQTNYTGAVTDIDEPPATPDANALVASGGIGVMLCGFPTPANPPSGTNNSSQMRVAVSAQGGAGGTETEVPDAITQNTNFGTGVTNIDEDADTPDGAVLAPTGDDGVLQVSLVNPSSAQPIDTTTNAQTVKVVLGKYKIGTGLDSGGGTPTFTLAIYNGASLHETVATGVSVTGTQQTFTYNWTASGGIDPDNVRVHLTTTADGGGPNKRSIAVDAINVDFAFTETTLNGIVRLYDNGVQKTPSASFTVAPSEGIKTITMVFDKYDLTTQDASNIECYVTQTDGAPTDYIDIEAVELYTLDDAGTNNFYLKGGNNTDGVGNAVGFLATATPTVTENVRTAGAAPDTYTPTKTEYSRIGLGPQDATLYSTKVYELFCEAIYAPTATGDTVTPTGIASAEAFGTATITTGNVNVVPSGVASAEAFGTATIALQLLPTGIASAEAFGTAQLNLQIRATGIATAEAFGTATLARGNVTVQATGIATAEAFGTAKLNLQIRATGIASAEAFGSATLVTGNVNVVATGIATAEAFGTPTVVAGNVTFLPSGIASAEAFGAPQVNLQIRATGIASAEAFGTLQVNQQVRATGIATAEAFGTAIVTSTLGDQFIATTGIASAEAFGTAKLNLNVVATGIATGEAFGAHTLTATYRFYPVAIATAEAFGSASVVPGNVTVLVNGIASAEAFGSATVVNTLLVADVGNIASAEAFGSATLTTGNVNVQPSGIASAEAFGGLQINLTISAAGDIASAEVFGSPNFVLNVHPTGIASQEAFGTPSIAVGNVNIIVNGIASQEAFGTHEVINTPTVNPPSIASAEAIGNPIVTPGNVNIQPSGIASAEAFGNDTIVTSIIISMTGIPSAEAFGAAVLDYPWTIVPGGIASAEAFGTTAVFQGNIVRPTGIPSAEAFGTASILGGLGYDSGIVCNPFQPIFVGIFRNNIGVPWS